MWVKHRNTPQYRKGDLVWLEGRNLCTSQPAAKLAARRHGPFPVEQVLSPAIYKLSLPSTWNIHLVFHIDLLTPYRETPFHRRNYEHPPPDLIANQEEYEIKKVLDAHHYGRKKTRQYLVKWKGYPDSDDEWVSQKDMSADEAIQEYEERFGNKREPSRTKKRIRHLMSSPPISVTSSPSTPTHSQLLSSLVDDELRQARATFPAPPQGQISPDSTQSLDLAPTTGIRSTSTKDDGEEVEEQLLQARTKTEAQRRCFWLKTRTEMKKRAREAAECSVKLRRAILVGFTPPSSSKGVMLMANDMNDAANSSKTANATSNPCGPLHAASSSPTFPTSSDNSETQAKLCSLNRPPMTWGTLRDQVRTPSSRQMEPLRPGAKKRRQEEGEDEGAGAGPKGHRGDPGGWEVRRYAA